MIHYDIYNIKNMQYEYIFKYIMQNLKLKLFYCSIA